MRIRDFALIVVIALSLSFAFFIGRYSKPESAKLTTVNVPTPVQQPNIDAQTEGARKAATAYSFAYSLYGSVLIYERLVTAWSMLGAEHRQQFEKWLQENKTGQSVNLPRFIFRGEVSIAEDNPYKVIVHGFEADTETPKPVVVIVTLTKNRKYQGRKVAEPEYLVESWIVSKPEEARNQ